MELYEILQVTPDCNMASIKKSYHKLAKIYHPDKVDGDSETFQKINNAYNILSNETSRRHYNTMNKTTKNKFILFLEKWFNEQSKGQTCVQSTIKKMFNFSDEILNNIDYYDFTDIIKLFTNSIVPDKKYNESIDCSDSDMNSWDETQAEYYDMLPLKYNTYNKYDIYLELNTTLNEITSNNIRKIKINRKVFDTTHDNSTYNTTFYFNCNHPYIVFNMGGDSCSTTSGNLIILLKLPPNYTWNSSNIIYNYNINLYEYIYGVDIKLNFNNSSYDINQWIPYRDGMNIDITNFNYMKFIVLLNLQYNDTNDNKLILQQLS